MEKKKHFTENTLAKKLTSYYLYHKDQNEK
jgi:hypothetical protein